MNAWLGETPVDLIKKGADKVHGKEAG